MDLDVLFTKKIAPKAELIDLDSKALIKGFKVLGRNQLLGRRVPKQWGGAAANREEYFTYTEQIQSYSGALGFFQRQHQAAARFIGGSACLELKDTWLKPMIKGKRKVGVSVSHLRNPRAPCVEARRTDGGWFLNGVVPWVSGYRLFDSLVMGFFCPDEGLEGMGLIAFKKSRAFKPHPIISTVALSSVNTLTVELKELFVPEQSIISLSQMGTYAETSDALNVQYVNLSAVALGFLRHVDHPHLHDAYHACRRTYLDKGADVQLYAEINKIATHLSHIARFMGGVRAVICPNEVERRCRELMLFSVILPQKPLLETCLDKLLT